MRRLLGLAALVLALAGCGSATVHEETVPPPSQAQVAATKHAEVERQAAERKKAAAEARREAAVNAIVKHCEASAACKRETAEAETEGGRRISARSQSRRGNRTTGKATTRADARRTGKPRKGPAGIGARSRTDQRRTAAQRTSRRHRSLAGSGKKRVHCRCRSLQILLGDS
jgi:hypothetical protein